MGMLSESPRINHRYIGTYCSYSYACSRVKGFAVYAIATAACINIFFDSL